MSIWTRWIAPEEAKSYYAEGWWRQESFSDHLMQYAREKGSAEAVVDSKYRLTFAQLKLYVERVALGLMRRGIGKGDVVATQLPSWAEQPIMFAATELIGAVFMPMSEALRPNELRYLLSITESPMVIIPASFKGFDYVEMYRQLKSELPTLKHVVVTRGKGLEGWLTFENLIAEPLEKIYPPDFLQRYKLGPDEIMGVFLTSGTTALPKMGMRSCNVLRFNAHDLHKYVTSLSGNDTSLCLAAISGGTGFGFGIVAPWVDGAKIVLQESWDVKQAFDLIVNERVTIVAAVPAQLVQMMDFLPQEHNYDFSSLRAVINAGAPLPPSVAQDCARRLGCNIFSCYGASDGGAPNITSLEVPPEKRFTTMGKPLPGFEVRIVDNNGNDVMPGEVGEIIWRGAGSGNGYYKNPIETYTAWTWDSWYLSGDLGAFDDEGYLKVVGRKKDMILRGGQNISPAELETTLAGHPAIKEAAALGMPDPKLGERVCVYVIPREGQAVTKEDVVAFLQEKGFAKYKLPERVEVVADFPRARDQKVVKSQLLEDISQKLKEEGLLA